MPENNQILSVEGQLVGMPLAGPESFSQQQLDYLKRALGVDETVLWSGTATNTNVTLNEALDNFERIKIYAYWKGTNTYDYYGYSMTELYTSELSSGKRFTVSVFANLNDGELYSIANFSVASTKDKLNLVNVKRATFTEQLVANNDGPTVYKVVGIHRIAGGN